MKKVFILLMSLVAIMTANLNVMAQETATAKASMGDGVNRSQHSFITNGNWNDGSHWDTGIVPPSGSDVVIMADAIIPAGYTAVVNEVSIEGGSITVSDGGQLRHNTEGLVVTMKKNIEPYEDVNGTDNYYLLAFPFSVDVAVPNAMTAIEGNDFYKFDGDYLEAEWRNNKQETIATVSGTTGYLYANSEAIELSLIGSTYPSYNEEVISVTVPYDDGSTNSYNGWALLGNPFTCNAYIYCHNSNNELVPMDFMVYDATGELMTLSGEPIAPMQGFFVKVTETTTVYIMNYADHSFHEYVDLGLPSGLLWATCNVGADNPEDYGDYFAWGETQPKDFYNISTYQYCMGSTTTLTKYCCNSYFGYNGFTDNLTTLLPEDDAATVNWGSDWRMPTKEEWEELYNNTTVTCETQNGVNGMLFSASNGNSLFLPAAGYFNYNILYDDDLSGYYWSCSLRTDYPADAWNFLYTFTDYSVNISGRVYGKSVRPVRSSGQNTAPTGAINGKFTINANGDQVYFSQGNLQYQASTNTWRFAEYQYDYIGSDNSNISSTYDGWIDLFGWGTSGYNHGANAYQPWNTSQSPSDYYAYGSATYNLYDQTGQADWGYNAISNGGSATNQWRTLTGGSGGEWDYVFNTRITTSGIRYAKAQVNNVNGVILLPDDWSESYYSLSETNNGGAGYGSNVISASNWTSSLQSHGAVFLPAAGYRCGTSVNGGNGCYWSASYKHSLSSYDAGFSDSSLGTAASEYVGRCDGQSVRLVRVAEN